MPTRKSSSKKSVPKRKISFPFIFAILFSLVLVVALIFVVRQSLEHQQTKLDLTKILETDWQAYKSNRSNFNGGLSMQILSPKGDYFISTDMGEKITNNTHFRIASVSKTFTAAAIMLLNQKGLLNIDDKVTDNIPGKNISYLPNTPNYNLPFKKDITIRQLLMHRAGIFDLSNNAIPNNNFSYNKPYVGQNYLAYTQGLDQYHQFTFDELIGVVSQNQLSFFPPGTKYHYSDTGYTILAKIVEQVSGKPYADFIKEELLVPNGLKDTIVIIRGSDQTIPDPYIKGYIWADNQIAEVTKQNMSPHVGEGSIISTPLDLATWAKKLFTGQAGLTKESVEMMKAGMSKGEGGNGYYGLGISYPTDTKYGHSGAHEGFLTDMIYNPKTDVAYVMFTNIWDCQTCGKSLESITTELKTMSTVADKVLQKLGY